MSKAFFISDVHLGVKDKKEEKEKIRYFSYFLDHVKENGKTLFLVGDIFDFWMEYRSVIPRVFFYPLVLLEKISASSVSVIYLSGNHDFAVGSFFKQELGIDIVHGSLESIILGKRFYITHGDELAGSPFIRGVLRNPLNQSLFKMMHPSLGLWVMKYVSRHICKMHDGKKKNDVFAKSKTSIEHICLEKKIDFFICGHFHLPHVEQLSNGAIYANLGMFSPHRPTYAEFDGNEILLKNLKDIM